MTNIRVIDKPKRSIFNILIYIFKLDNYRIIKFSYSELMYRYFFDSEYKYGLVKLLNSSDYARHRKIWKLLYRI